MQKNNQKCDASETAKRMIKTNQVIISEHYIKHGDGLLAVSDGDEKKAWKSYNEKLLNTEFTWDRKSLSGADTVKGAPSLLDKKMVWVLISNLKNEKTAGPSAVVPQMVKAVGKARVKMITGLLN